MSQFQTAGVNKLSAMSDRFRIVTLIVTYQCALSCDMCFFKANPTRKEVIDERIARDVIRDAADLGIPQVGFAGGEAVMQLDLLCKLISLSREYDRETILTTSGYWGRSSQQRNRIVDRLVEAGLENIQISLDDEHLKFLTIEDVANAIVAAKKAGFKDIKILGTSRGNTYNFSELVFYIENVLNISTDGLDLVDRHRVSHSSYEKVANITYLLPELDKKYPRAECMRDIMIDVNGDVYPCCNNFVGRIGNLNEKRVSDILSDIAGNEVFLGFLKKGPGGFAVDLDARNSTSLSKDRYGSWCEVCSKIFGDPCRKNLICQ